MNDLKPVNISYKQASGAVKATAGYVYSVVLTGGSDAASVTLKDGGSSGDAKMVLKAAAGATVVYNFTRGLTFATGIYATITGTTPDVTIGYR